MCKGGSLGIGCVRLALAQSKHQQGKGGQAVGAQHRKSQLFAAPGRVGHGIAHRHHPVGQPLSVLPGKMQGDSTLLPGGIKHHPAGIGQTVKQGALDGQRGQPVRPQAAVQPDHQPPADAQAAFFIHLPAAGVQHRSADQREQKEQCRILRQRRPQRLPVALEQHLQQWQQVDEQGLA